MLRDWFFFWGARVVYIWDNLLYPYTRYIITLLFMIGCICRYIG